MFSIFSCARLAKLHSWAVHIILYPAVLPPPHLGFNLLDQIFSIYYQSSRFLFVESSCAGVKMLWTQVGDVHKDLVIVLIQLSQIFLNMFKTQAMELFSSVRHEVKNH